METELSVFVFRISRSSLPAIQVLVGSSETEARERANLADEYKLMAQAPVSAGVQISIDLRVRGGSASAAGYLELLDPTVREGKAPKMTQVHFSH